MNARRSFAFCIFLFHGLFGAHARSAPPVEAIDEPPATANAEMLPYGAAAKLASSDDALQALAKKRTELRDALSGADALRQQEGRRARRLARELLVAELHGHALASSPTELVQNAAVRSGLRRTAARTLAAHAARRDTVDETQLALTALDLDEARIKGERAVAEAEQRLEHEEAKRRRVTLSHIFEGSPVEDSTETHARIRVAAAGGDEETDSESFAARKGSLPLPLQRRCRIKSKRNDQLGGPYLAMTAKSATNVRAVAGGTVVFADELSPYGKLVVVDHGHSYFTVYGGLSQISTGNGDPLTTGAVIGSVAEQTPLVFQLRIGNRTLSGFSWFQANRKAQGKRDTAP